MNVFGNTPVGIIVLDVILLIFGGVLIPLMWKIFNAMDAQLSQSKVFTAQIGTLCNEIKEITSELVEARVRDAELRTELGSIRVELRDHIKEERNK